MASSALPIKWEVRSEQGQLLGRVSVKRMGNHDAFHACPPRASSYSATTHQLFTQAVKWLESVADRPSCPTCHSIQGMPCDPQQHRRAGTEVLA